MIRADLIVEGAAEVVTCAGPDPRSTSRGAKNPVGGLASASQGQIGVIPNGVVACAGERIVFVGTAAECAANVALDQSGRRLDARGCTVLPGFIDAHTHLPFGGWRDAEFEMRLAGRSYSEIAEAGGGILSTLRATRALPVADLAELVRERLDAMLLAGTTTVEAKSGYGLSLESELTILRALAGAADHAVEILPTFLGAHVVAPEYRDGRRDDYVRLIVEEMLPRVAAERLAYFCDVFIDHGAFTLDEARQILSAAKSLGFGLRVHAEQLTHTGATQLAASLGALSVDHLERMTTDDIAHIAATWQADRGEEGPPSTLTVPTAQGAARDATDQAHPPTGTAGQLRGAGSSPGGSPPFVGTAASPGSARESLRRGSGSGTVAILLPGATHTLREKIHPPARALIEAGVPVALATDFNPGTSPCHAMPAILNLACLLFGMTPDEAILGATRNAALSLGIEDRAGTIEAGKQADLVLWRVPGRRHLAYRFGANPCAAVVKKGRIVVENGRLSAPRAAARNGGNAMLIEQTVHNFLESLASEKPTPGGGSASALAGAQAAALMQMVIAVTLKNEKYAASRPALEPIAKKLGGYRTDLELLVDRDSQAYDTVVAANRLPKETEEEKAARKAAREKAFLFAAEIPLKTVELACAVAALAAEAAPHINPNAASDLLVAGLLADAAVGGGAANVRINLTSIKSEEFSTRASERLEAWTRQSAASTAAIRARFA